MKKLLQILPIALLLAGCGKQQPKNEAIKDQQVQVEQAGEIDPSAGEGAKQGGTYSAWGGPFPKSLNMWLDYNSFSLQVTGLMFQPLIDLHSTEDRPIGLLADSWEISPDKMTFTFKISPDAKWSDGQPVTAEDVQFYYDVIMDPKNQTSLFRVDMGRFDRPKVIDEKTVSITAHEVHWKNFWTAGGFYAFPKHAWKDANFNELNFTTQYPVVNGPYALEEVKIDRSVKLVRRGDWWGRVRKYNLNKFNFDHIVFKSMEDQAKALENLKKEEFDSYAIYSSKIWVKDTLDPSFEQVQKNWIARQAVYNDLPRGFQGFAMNMRRPIFQDVRVRQALACLLNRELMNEKLMFNQYFLLNSYFPDIYPNYTNPDIPITKYDPDKARALLKEAGWQPGADGVLTKDGQPFSIKFLYEAEGDMRHLNIYLEDLKSVGIQASVDQVSESTLSERVDHYNFDILWRSWQAVRLDDPETMWSSKQADEVAGQNICGLKDPEVDALIDQQKTEFDAGKRKDILKKIDARLMALCPYVLMWEANDVRLLYWNRFGTPKYVLSKYGDESDALEYWWFDPDKSKALDDARQKGAALPALPAEVHYQE
ncbi:MAG TPA: extracellular solute-binding protein [Chthoniobacteraceae bacterium]|nr:extracellular solute-binding protein [Chthoniobacteraceae bacterium]